MSTKHLYFVASLTLATSLPTWSIDVDRYMDVSATSLNTRDRAYLEALLINNQQRQTPVINIDGYRSRSRWNELLRAKGQVFGRCGLFDPNVTISDSFSSGRVKGMLDGVVDNAKGAVTGLAGSILKQANPGMFEFIENGISLGFDDYLSSVQSCEQVQQLMVKNAPDGLLRQASAGETVNTYAQNATGKTNIVDLFRSGSAISGDEGVTGVDGKKYGGAGGQQPLRVIDQTTLAGWCGLTETSSGACTNVTNNVSSKSSSAQSQITTIFPSAGDAQEFAANTVGEVSLRICDNCSESVTAVPPQSLSQQVEFIASEIKLDILALLKKDPLSLTTEDIQSVSAPGYALSRETFISLQNETPANAEIFSERLANDVATSLVIDKVITLRQILETGSANATLLSNEVVRQETELKIATLDKQMVQFETEQRLRNSFDSQTRLLLNHRRKQNSQGASGLNLGGI